MSCKTPEHSTRCQDRVWVYTASQRAHNEGCIMTQSKQSEPKTMEDVDHPGHAGILTKCNQTQATFVQ